MSTTVDQRIVEMQFDNRNFENNVQTSLSTLDRLKQKLNLTGAAKGFEEVNTAANRVNFSGMTAGIEQVGVKFSYMQATIQHQLNQIVDSCVNAGKRMVSALTIDPVKTGFSEYETQINAVQTILANTESKGTTLNDVNAALDELNTYADKTIYNFTQMTRNIGTFTAAGVDLDTSVNAIQGIANLAAVSGSTSQQASTAMYQLSQALSAGTVKLMDWNSVVNAGMGGQVFQDALKDTARAHGIAIDDIIKKQGSFRNSLSEGWITSEILTETLAKFTMTTEGLTEAQIEQNRQMLKSKGYTDEQIEAIFKLGTTATDAATKVKTYTQLWETLKESAQSGWTQSWELIVGDFEEAKELWTKVSDVIGGAINKSAKNRNDLLSGSLDNSWEKMIKKINEAGIESNIFETKLRETLEAHGQDVDKLIEDHGSLEKAFRSGAVSADFLKETIGSLSKSMVDLSEVEEGLKRGSKGDDVKKIQQALINAGQDVGKAGIDGSLGPDTEKAVKAFQELNGLEVTGIIDEKTLEALKEANVATEDLTESCGYLIDKITELGGREKLIRAVKNAFQGLKNIAEPISDAFKSVFPSTISTRIISLNKAIDGVVSMTEKFAEFTKAHGKDIEKTFRGIFSVIDIGWTFVKDLAGGLVDLIKNFSGLGGGILSTTAMLGDWLSNLRKSVKHGDIFGKAVDKIVGFVSKTVDKFKEFKNSISETFNNPEIGGFVGLMQTIWNVVKKIGTGIINTFSSVGTTLSRVFSGDSDIWNVMNSGLFAGILTGIARFTNALPNMFDNVNGIIWRLKSTLHSVGEAFDSFMFNLNARSLLTIAGAIAILAASIMVIAGVDRKALDQSLGAITILLVDLVGAITILEHTGKRLSGITSVGPLITRLAVSVLILSFAISKLAKIDGKDLSKGIIAVGALMLELVMFTQFAKFDKKMKSSAKGILIISAAMLVMAQAVKSFSQMELDELGRGLLAFAVTLGAVVLAMKLLPQDWSAKIKGFGNVKSTTNLISAGLAFLAVAASMKIFASAMKDFATLKLEEIGKGLVAMSGTLLAVTLAMKAMPKGVFGSAVGLVVVAGALMLMANVIEDFNNLGVNVLTTGILAIGAALAVLAIGMTKMSGTLSGSASLLVAAAALMILTPALKTLGEMSIPEIIKSLITLAGAFGIVGVAGALLSPLIPSILGLAGAFALFGLSILTIGAGIGILAAGLTALAVSGTAGATALVAALSVIIVGTLSLIPSIIEVVGQIILALCDTLITCAPKIAETILVVVTEVLAALVTYTPQIVDSLMKFVIGVLDAFAENLPTLIVSAVNVISAFFQGIVDALGTMDASAIMKGLIGAGLLSGLMLALSAIVGLIPGAMIGVLGVGAVVAELALVLAAIGALSQIPGLNWLVEEGGNFLELLGTAIGQFAGGIVGGFMGGVSSAFPQIGSDLSAFMTNAQPFIDGARKIDASVMDGVKALGQAILILTAADILEGIASWLIGGSSLSSFGSEIALLGTSLNEFVTNLGEFGPDKIMAVQCAAHAVKALAEAAATIPNEGGWAGKIFGENGIGAFSSQLPIVGMALKMFVAGLGTFGEDQVNAIKCAADGIAAMATAAEGIPNEGGWAGKIFGENGIGAFASQLPIVGTSLRAFVTGLGTFNEDTVTTITCAANAIKSMASAASGIDGQSEWAKKIFGDNGIGAFSSQFGTLGTNLSAFAKNLGTFGEDKVITVTTAIRAIKAFTSLADADLSGAKKNLEGFGDKLGGFATDISDFCNNLPDSDSVSAAVSTMDTLKNMLTDIANMEGGIGGKFTESLKNIGTDGINSFVEAFAGNTPVNRVKTTVRDLLSIAVAAMEEKLPKMKNIGESLMGQFVEGVSSKRAAVKSVMSSQLSSAVESAKDYYDSFYSAGSYLVDGFTAGIDESTWKAEAEASAMATAAKEAAEAALGINSPSKVFYAIGGYAGQGLINALSDYGSKVYSAGSEMAESAKTGLGDAMSKVRDVLNGEMDTQPTIRPVLDLSDVKHGANTIGSLIGSDYSMSLATNVGAISTGMHGLNQNGGNSDVVSALNKLREDISKLGGNNYTINGINYNNDQVVSDAIETLVRYARMERRM